MTIINFATRCPAVFVSSLPLIAVIASPVAYAQEGTDLPRIIGTELPGTIQALLDITIDGISISTVGNDAGGLLPDVDGDGVVEAYLKAVEPGETCTTLIYLPSKQTRSAHLQSDDLGSYTRIRNFDSQTQTEYGADPCADYNPSMSLQVLGDLTGDGINEIVTQGYPEGYREMIIDGTVSNGTLIELDNPVVGQTSLIGLDVGVQAVGDFNGDGRTNWYMSQFEGNPNELDTRVEDCSIFSSPSSLPAEISFSSLADSTPLATFSRNEYDNCPRVVSIGDVNGDGIDDIAIKADSNADTYVVHGKASRVLGDNYADDGYRVLGADTGNEQAVLDFDGDGFDDVLMPAYDFDSNRLLAGTGTLVAYGGPDGVIKADDFPSRENGVVTQVIHKFQKPVWHSGSGWDVVFSPQSIGDINGDGADDVRIINYSNSFNDDDAGSKNQNYSIVYGTPGKRFPVLIEASVDGGNGVYWSEDNQYQSSVILRGDFNGDAIDDLAYGERVIKGASRTRLATEPQYVHLFNGADSLDVLWSTPDDPSSLSGYRIVSNGQTVAELGTDQNHYRVDRVANQAIMELRLQSIDSAGRVIGEAIRHPDLTEPEYVAILGDFQDAEYNAQGTVISADAYTLTGKSYGPELGELFWNSTKRFVLVWRNGEIIDRVEGNSYMVYGGGEYFITTDYAGSIPDDGNTSLFASGTLHRSNVVSVNEVSTDTPSTPLEPPVTGVLPAAPDNLHVTVYSDTAAELFWDRSTDDNILGYLVSRDGGNIASTSGISFYDSTRQAGVQYIYTVVVVDTDGFSSNPATVSTGIYGADDETTVNSSLPLTGQVYSSTALELFWNIDDLDNASSLSFDVLQDGQSVSVSSARSFFADTLSTNTTYRFELVARNAQGDEVARSNELLLTTR